MSNQRNLMQNEEKESAVLESKSDILKLISPSKSKFFMPKPRISSHSKCALQIKSIVDLHHCPLQQSLVAMAIGSSSTPKQQVDEDTEYLRLQKEQARTGTDLNNFDASNMLAITISCVMLMASNVSEISEEYLSWAENYLSQIKDPSGEHPPNIQGILNHIKYIRTRPVVVVETTPPCINKLKVPSRFSDIRGCNNSSCSQIKSKQQDKRIGSRVTETSYKKRNVSNVQRTNSCATISGYLQRSEKK